MIKEINYEALSKRLHKAINVAKKIGLSIIPRGGYAMDYDINKLPPYSVGLFGALSIVEGPGARSKLDLTYLQTSALEAGFNSVLYSNAPTTITPPKRIKKDEVYLKLEAIGKELAKKVVPEISKRSPTLKKKKKSAPPSYRNTWSTQTASAGPAGGMWIDGSSAPQAAPASLPATLQTRFDRAIEIGLSGIGQVDAIIASASAPEGVNIGAGSLERSGWMDDLVDDAEPPGGYRRWSPPPPRNIPRAPNTNYFGDLNISFESSNDDTESEADEELDS